MPQRYLFVYLSTLFLYCAHNATNDWHECWLGPPPPLKGDINKTTTIAKAGVRVIQSLGADYVASQRPWSELIAQEFMPPGLSPEQEKNVLGGESCMWGET